MQQETKLFTLEENKNYANHFEFVNYFRLFNSSRAGRARVIPVKTNRGKLQSGSGDIIADNELLLAGERGAAGWQILKVVIWITDLHVWREGDGDRRERGSAAGQQNIVQLYAVH